MTTPDRFEWEKAIRDDPGVSKLRLVILLILATYWDRKRNSVTVKTTTIAEKAGVTDRLVRNELTWARAAGYLDRVARGHHRGDGQNVASTYVLTLSLPVAQEPVEVPAQQVAERPVEAKSQLVDGSASTGTGRHLYRNTAAIAPITSSEKDSEGSSLPTTPSTAPSNTFLEYGEIVGKSDPLWEALMEACEIDTRTITQSARGGYNKALKELRQVGATVDDCYQRAANYRSHLPNAALTPLALAKHWAMCATPKMSTTERFLQKTLRDLDPETARTYFGPGGER